MTEAELEFEPSPLKPGQPLASKQFDPSCLIPGALAEFLLTPHPPRSCSQSLSFPLCKMGLVLWMN